MTSLFGGIMAERFGGKGVVGVSMLLSGFVTGTTPYLTHDSFWFLFASRFVLGVFGVSIIRMFQHVCSNPWPNSMPNMCYLSTSYHKLSFVCLFAFAVETLVLLAINDVLSLY